MSAPPDPLGELCERILAAVRDVEKPVTFKGLAKLVKAAKANDESFRVALDLAVAAGGVHRWPDYKRSQYFWRLSAEEKAREEILTAAATLALSKLALAKAAAKNLRGIPVKFVETVVAALVAEKQLQDVPAFTGSSKLLVRAGGQNAYFNAVRVFVEGKIRKAGFDPAAFFSESSSPVDTLTDGQVDAAALILEAVRSLEPVRGVPVSTLRLRNQLSSLSKREFDAAALELRKHQEVFLSQHVDPYNISEEDKNLLIDGQDGTYYVAIAIR